MPYLPFALPGYLLDHPDLTIEVVRLCAEFHYSGRVNDVKLDLLRLSAGSGLSMQSTCEALAFLFAHEYISVDRNTKSVSLKAGVESEVVK